MKSVLYKITQNCYSGNFIRIFFLTRSDFFMDKILILRSQGRNILVSTLISCLIVPLSFWSQNSLPVMKIYSMLFVDIHFCYNRLRNITYVDE